MPDISMCKNNKCQKRAYCYRYLAYPSPRQCYADFEFDSDGFCDWLKSCFFRIVRDVKEVDKEIEDESNT
jgi:hypothetical protein